MLLTLKGWTWISCKCCYIKIQVIVNFFSLSIYFLWICDFDILLTWFIYSNPIYRFQNSAGRIEVPNRWRYQSCTKNQMFMQRCNNLEQWKNTIASSVALNTPNKVRRDTMVYMNLSVKPEKSRPIITVSVNVTLWMVKTSTGCGVQEWHDVYCVIWFVLLLWVYFILSLADSRNSYYYHWLL